jgi:hypothetical protein
MRVATIRVTVLNYRVLVVECVDVGGRLIWASWFQLYWN